MADSSSEFICWISGVKANFKEKKQKIGRIKSISNIPNTVRHLIKYFETKYYMCEKKT